ncbi:hypothetical protein HDU77_008234 [Chytriomyces hyalinus]|nr:hypothetical protein HDU77_008234 [Chytriomyces hyalinus]
MDNTAAISMTKATTTYCGGMGPSESAVLLHLNSVKNSLSHHMHHKRTTQFLRNTNCGKFTLFKEAIAALPEGKVLDDAARQKIYVELEGIQTTAQMPLFSIVPHLLFLLAHSPTNQKLVMAEISKVNAKTALTVKHVTAMTNLNACLLEALRLCPPQAVLYNRTSSQNSYKLPGQWSFPKS